MKKINTIIGKHLDIIKENNQQLNENENTSIIDYLKKFGKVDIIELTSEDEDEFDMKFRFNGKHTFEIRSLIGYDKSDYGSKSNAAFAFIYNGKDLLSKVKGSKPGQFKNVDDSYDLTMLVLKTIMDS